MITRAGSGHIGTSFSCMDIVSWLFLNELRVIAGKDGATDTYFSSKGHDAPGLYSVLIALGLLDFDLLHGLRRLGGLPGHPDVSIPFMQTNTGPLGMGISKAKGMVQADRRLGRRGSFYVLTGDGELQEGQIWESLASAVRDRMGEITVIVDRNQVQSDTWVDEVSALGDLRAKFEAFGWHAVECSGHDLTALQRTFAALATIRDRPKVIIADTRKGSGVSFMLPQAMDSSDPMYRFHSGAPAMTDYANAFAELKSEANRILESIGERPLQLAEVAHTPAAPPPTAQRLVPAYAAALVDQAARTPTLVALDADLVLDCGIIPFRRRFPDRFFECGIAEQDMVSQAGGMALRGLLPVVHSFACFLSTRPNEQIYNNATERGKIIYVAPLAGLLPAGPGHSHQSLRDIAVVGCTPGITMIQPSCESEVALALDYCVNETPGSSYLRLVSIPVDVPFELPKGYVLQPGHGVQLREGAHAVVIAYGPVMLSEAWRAADLLRDRGVSLAVVNLPWLNRVDPDWLTQLASSHRVVFTIDDHYLAGGQGQLVASEIAALGLDAPPRVKSFGLSDIPLSGGNIEVLEAHGLSASRLAEEMTAFIAAQSHASV
jgi:transketolase